MAKIDDRKKLTRGIKLAPEHVFDTLSDAKTQLQGSITDDQLQKPLAPFRINLAVPHIGPDTVPAGGIVIPFVLPPLQEFFEKEQLVDSSGAAMPLFVPEYTPDLPQVLLKGVGFSWDQRDEPAAIASEYWSDGQSTSSDDYGVYGMSKQKGMLVYDAVNRLDIRISLLKKNQLFFSRMGKFTSTQDYTASTAWSTGIGSPAFAGDNLRLNPFFQDDIDIAIDPYCTYAIKIECPGLKDLTTHDPSSATIIRNLCLLSAEITLKFAHRLVTRDSGSSINNIAENAASGVDKYGVRTSPSVTVNVPSSAEAITADDNASGTDRGIGANISNIDDEFKNKLRGEVTRNSDLPVTEHLRHSAGYDVIAVPLYSNLPTGGLAAMQPSLTSYPYLADAAGSDGVYARAALYDRRVIPIHHTYTLHHVFLAWNWTPWSLFNDQATFGGVYPRLPEIPPVNHSINLDVGVGIGSGMKADQFGYQQMAFLQLQDPQGFATGDTTQVRGWGEGSSGTTGSIVDRLNGGMGVSRRLKHGDNDYGNAVPAWNWEIHQVPLNWQNSNDVTNTNSYYGQDQIISFGRSNSNTKRRTSLLNSGRSSLTAADQFIEVRTALYTTETGSTGSGVPLNLGNLPVTTAGSSGGTASSGFSGDTQAQRGDGSYQGIQYVGYGGCWVYLICKKHLTR